MTDSLFHKGGVGDLVLLDKVSEEAITETLSSRFSHKLIYTYIGDVLLSLNPFQDIPQLYSTEKTEKYRNRYYYENEPHIFALAENMYRSLKQEKQDQCVIISGESGSGKTEASKKIMNYISDVSGDGREIHKVKERLLSSNPVLESFGNAKTLRNNNSSRFGKYLEIYFDLHGDPIGGKIKTFLLEKSRVCQLAQGERNFHIFYQILMGLDASQKTRFRLKEASYYRILDSGGTLGRNGVEADFEDERTALEETVRGLEALNISKEDRIDLFSILSAILWIGEVSFETDEQGKTVVVKKGEISGNLGCDPLSEICALLGLDELSSQALEDAFIRREMKVYGELLYRDHSLSEARDTRDALCKLIYSRLFQWLVEVINTSMDPSQSSSRASNCLGVLDIYGFEIFEHNSFEQFCINYVNEKLQQVFIDRTIRREQEEYLEEGIVWQPVEYFNNKVVCQLIESKGKGIIDLLNETCVFPKGNDELFIEKINTSFSSNSQFAKSSVKESQLAFSIRHFAGTVLYDGEGFVDKNKDLVWNDLQRVCMSSSVPVMGQLFPTISTSESTLKLKRPPTASTQFRSQVKQLVETLEASNPNYVRCIKPNDDKRGFEIQEDLFIHQIRYLGLLENVKVRRAGFAFRMGYEKFLMRNKIIAAECWPHYKGKGGVLEGCRILMKEMDQKEGSQFQCGKSKLFLKAPRTILDIEQKRQERIAQVFSEIKALWRGFVMRSTVEELNAGNILHSVYKGYTARSAYTQFQAACRLQAYWRGYMHRTNMNRLKAVYTLQSTWKGYTLRNYFRCVIGAILVQNKWKGFVLQTAFQQRQAGAVLCSRWKGFLQRKWQLRYTACRAVQTLWRAYKQRLDWFHHRNAIVIQTSGRKFLTQNWLRNTKAAVLVQQTARGFLSRRFHRFSHACMCIQRMYQQSVWSSFLSQYRSAVLIQSIWKGRQVRRCWEERQAAISLQTCFRYFSVRNFYTAHCAVVLVQSYARIFSARLLAERTRAAMLLRQVFHGFEQRKPDLACKSLCLGLVNQRKLRHRKSANTHFIGNYFPDETLNPSLNALLSEYSDTDIFFMDEMIKISRRFGLYQRMAVVTEKALYDVERTAKGAYKLHNRYPMDSIKQVALSCEADSFILVRFCDSFDAFYRMERKNELMTVLAERKYLSSGGDKLTVDVSNSLSYTPKGCSSRFLEFERMEMEDVGGDEKVNMFPKAKAKCTRRVLVEPSTQPLKKTTAYLNDLRFRVKTLYDE